jgi:hypothetical protein
VIKYNDMRRAIAFLGFAGVAIVVIVLLDAGTLSIAGLVSHMRSLSFEESLEGLYLKRNWRFWLRLALALAACGVWLACVICDMIQHLKNVRISYVSSVSEEDFSRYMAVLFGVHFCWMACMIALLAVVGPIASCRRVERFAPQALRVADTLLQRWPVGITEIPGLGTLAPCDKLRLVNLSPNNMLALGEGYGLFVDRDEAGMCVLVSLSSCNLSGHVDAILCLIDPSVVPDEQWLRARNVSWSTKRRVNERAFHVTIR